MKYVYACDNPTHPRIVVEHSMKENPEIPCNECDRPMHRVPQLFTWGHNPTQVLLEKMDERFRITKIKNDIRRRYA